MCVVFMLIDYQVQEWFKNRRKKDKLGQERLLGRCLPKGRGARRSTDEGQGVSGMDQSGSLVQQAAMVAERGVTLDTGGGVAVGQQIELQHQPPHVLTIGMDRCTHYCTNPHKAN